MLLFVGIMRTPVSRLMMYQHLIYLVYNYAEGACC